MRRWDVGPARFATPPAHLVHSDVEDWVDARDIARHTFTVDCAAEPATAGRADCTFELERLAHVRRGIERAAWLDGHGVSGRDQWRLWSGDPPRLGLAGGPASNATRTQAVANSRRRSA